MQVQGHEPVYVPRLDTPNPFVAASRDEDKVRGGNAYALLASAARLNEPRVRELIALAKSAQGAVWSAGGTPSAPTTIEGIDRARELLEALEFGLGALLPPVNIRIKLPPLAGARSLSGKSAQRKAA